MESVVISSDKELFSYLKEEPSNILNNFILNESDDSFRSFLPREKNSSYVIKKLNSGKYILYEGFDYNKSFGLQYDKITPISNEKIVNSDKCYALKVERNGKSFYISPIDLMQTPLDNEIQSIIMSSFISDSYKVFSKAVCEVEFSDMISKNKFFKNFNSLDTTAPHKLSKFATAPISTSVDTKRYDPRICELIAGRFYSLIETYKKCVIENTSLSKKSKDKLLKDFFPKWEENTLKQLFEISQQSNIKSTKRESTSKTENASRIKKVNNATISVKKEMTDEEANEIRELLTQNTIDNGGTLEYATLTRDIYVSVESDGEILGYVALVSHGDSRLYVGVTAVKKEYQGLGVGSKMYDFIKQHSSQFSVLTADVRNFNTASKRLHFSHGFKMIDDYGDIIDPNDLVYNDKYNLALAFDLTTIKNRKPLEVGISMKLADLDKKQQVSEIEQER